MTEPTLKVPRGEYHKGPLPYAIPPAKTVVDDVTFVALVTACGMYPGPLGFVLDKNVFFVGVYTPNGHALRWSYSLN
jgi:hypothetical protein